VIGNKGAFHKSNSAKLRKRRQFGNRGISKVMATPQIDVSDPVALCNKLDHGRVRDLCAMSKV
jgi:hypothetical protein